MKWLEVMAELEKGSTKTYEATTLSGNKLQIRKTDDCTSVTENPRIVWDWQPVRQPVPWQEAIQEFAKGKKLVVSFNNQEWTLGELVELPNYLDIAITKGEWYVED